MDGKEVWKVDEPNADAGEKKPGQEKPRWTGSWSTPVFVPVDGREQLLMSWPQRLIAFEPKSGKELWSCAGLNDLVYTSPIHDKGIVVAMGGFGGKSVAVRAGGTGDVTESRRLWHHPRTKQRIGSGVIHDGHIYILNEDSLAHCYELESGKMIWEQRLTGAGKDNTETGSTCASKGSRRNWLRCPESMRRREDVCCWRARVNCSLAVALYESLGFRRIPAYYANPLPEVVYLELKV